MNFGFVPRKTYEILQENCKKINEERIVLAKRNKDLQIKVKELKAEIERLTIGKTEIASKTRKPRKTTKKEAK